MNIDYHNWLMAFLRVGAFLLVLPFFSIANFPVVMRVALSALVALLLAPLLPPMATSQATLFDVVGTMTQEISIGLLLGFVSRMIFYAVDLAGNFVASEMGLNLAAVFNPLSGQSSQAPGMILFFLAAVVMFTLDLHHWILAGLQATYTVLPVGSAHLNTALFENVVRHTGNIFVVALQVSAPVIAVSFVITIVFAILSRAVPQMNVFAESFSFRIAGCLIVFGFTLHLAATHVMNYLHRLPEDLLLVGQLLGGKS